MRLALADKGSAEFDGGILITTLEPLNTNIVFGGSWCEAGGNNRATGAGRAGELGASAASSAACSAESHHQAGGMAADDTRVWEPDGQVFGANLRSHEKHAMPHWWCVPCGRALEFRGAPGQALQQHPRRRDPRGESRKRAPHQGGGGWGSRARVGELKGPALSEHGEAAFLKSSRSFSV